MVNVLIFGAKDKRSPFPRINFVGNGESRLFFSRTNFNLLLAPEEYTNLSLGTLLEKSNELLGVLPTSSLTAANGLLFAPEVCLHCAEQSLGCPLLVKEVDELAIEVEGEKLSLKKWTLKDEIEVGDWTTVCPFLQRLLKITETEAERKFLQLYLDAHLQFFLQEMFLMLTWHSQLFWKGNRSIIRDILVSEPLRRVHESKGWGRNGGAPSTVAAILLDTYDRSGLLKPMDVEIPISMKFLLEEGRKVAAVGFKADIGTAVNLTSRERYDLGLWLRRALGQFPALVPQVWLRHVYEPTLGPKDPLKDEAYSRVDFVMLWNGKKAVIEIDGPEHYADWDSRQKAWKISEDIYTRNLKRERRLRQEGWMFFRLSNQEVEEANSWHDIDEVLGLTASIDAGVSPFEHWTDYFSE